MCQYSVELPTKSIGTKLKSTFLAERNPSESTGHLCSFHTLYDKRLEKINFLFPHQYIIVGGTHIEAKRKCIYLKC